MAHLNSSFVFLKHFDDHNLMSLFTNISNKWNCLRNGYQTMPRWQQIAIGAGSVACIALAWKLYNKIQSHQNEEELQQIGEPVSLYTYQEPLVNEGHRQSGSPPSACSVRNGKQSNYTVTTDEGMDEEESTSEDTVISKEDHKLLRQQSLNICIETDPIDVDETCAGLITFFEKHVTPQYAQQIFSKCDVECISNAQQLTEILTLCLLIYKVKVFQAHNTRNGVHDRTDTMRIHKTDFEPIAEYLSNWIMHGYGHTMGVHEDDYDLSITKESFASDMHCYLQKFVSEQT
eukprot:306431_1